MPWSLNALLLLILCNGVAAVVIVIGWYGVSTRGTVNSQLPWAESAIVGALAAGIADCTWLMRGRRAIGEERRALLTVESWRARHHREVPVASLTTSWVRAKGMTRVHRAGCPLVAGKSTTVVRRPGSAPRCDICGEQ